MFDSHYIEDLKKGNPSVQKELVDFFSGKMLSIARRYLADDHLAYDVLQESWIAIFNNIKTYKEEIAPIEAWIYRIVVNQSLKEIKKRKRKIEFVAEFALE
ncbi:MAG: sigma factor, partial [Saprospiraceae bacterium]